MVMIAFKGAVQDFFNNLLTSPQTVSSTYTQVARKQLCANNVQHIERLSHATCCFTCHIVRRDSSATEFDRVQIAFIFALPYWLNHQPMKVQALQKRKTRRWLGHVLGLDETRHPHTELRWASPGKGSGKGSKTGHGAHGRERWRRQK